ncbi:MAG: hypothetical protein IJK98_04840, partial [Clostridia bacterium]|nr:hypothetical protein [Clostridia bacterium]
VTAGVACRRCGQTVIPSFNTLVNRMKEEDHTFSTFTYTKVTVKPPRYSGIMTMMRKEFQKAIADSIGATTRYSDLKENVALDNDSFHLRGTPMVSLLTEADVESVITERVNGPDFIADLPDVYVSENNLPCDLNPYKRQPATELLKVTVTVLPETYSGSKDEGGSVHIGKVLSNYGETVTEAMNKVYSFNEGVLESEGDVASELTVTWYFDAQTLAPVAAVYHTVTDSTQKINIYSDEADVGVTNPSGYVSVEIINNADSYYFFDTAA